MKKIGLYNRWLATLGGGEQYSLAVAEHLSQRDPLCKVDVISHTPVDKDFAAKQLNLDLSRVSFVIVPDNSMESLTKMTRSYDFFINSSFLDFVPTQAPKSAMITFFPAPINHAPAERFRSSIGRMIKRELFVPSFIEGVFGVEQKSGAHIRRTAQCVKINIPPSPVSLTVKFAIAAENPNVRQAVIRVNQQQQQCVDLHLNQLKHIEIKLPPNPFKTATQLEIEAQSEGNERAGADFFKMRISQLEIDHRRYRLYQWLFEQRFKEWGLRLHGIPENPSSHRQIIHGYDAIWSISQFTRKWVKNYWQTDSHVLYPSVPIESFKVLPKQNTILSVGRFFAGSHNKKHLVMVQAFREMVDAGLVGWTLKLIGGVSPDAIHLDYVQRVIEAAKGYPIEIKINLPHDELIKSYGESAIYWHASGYGENEKAEPIKFEHFGISTVEAMASGCVPVVIGCGGQPEIVQHQKSGFLWQTTEALKSYTLNLVQDIRKRNEMSVEAQRQSKNYSREQFKIQLDKLMQPFC